MAEPKTKPTDANALKFLQSVPDEGKRKDALTLLKLFQNITGEKPHMWGNNMIGFGMYHYKSEKSSKEGDWPLTAFSPRKQNLTLYIMSGFAVKELKPLLKKLGKYKVSGGSCLYVNRLEDVDLEVLKRIIKISFVTMKKKWAGGKVSH